VFPAQTIHQPVQTVECEISKPDKDSIDGDQPDSGIEVVDSKSDIKEVMYINSSLLMSDYLIRSLQSVDTT